MELNLDSSPQKVRPPISRIVLHDEKGNAQFMLEYDVVDQNVTFQHLQDDTVTDTLVETKSKLTTEKGVEAFGSFITGADNEIPVYRHLLSLYFPKNDSTFTKFHVTVDDTLEHINLENSLLFAVECYAVLYDVIAEFIEEGKVTVEKYPLLSNFFFRIYQFDPYIKLMSGRDIHGDPLKDETILSNTQSLMDVIERNREYLDSADLYIMTITGAIVAYKQFLDDDLTHPTLHMMTHSSINSPGMFSSNGVVTLWFPFTKTRVGKINRAISTTLNTLSYASANRDMKEQVQKNIAHKFHDLVDIVSTYDETTSPTLGLQSNVGQLVCSLDFKEEYENDMETIMRVTQSVSTKVKEYGQSILSRVAKEKKFEPITK